MGGASATVSQFARMEPQSAEGPGREPGPSSTTNQIPSATQRRSSGYELTQAIGGQTDHPSPLHLAALAAGFGAVAALYTS